MSSDILEEQAVAGLPAEVAAMLAPVLNKIREVSRLGYMLSKHVRLYDRVGLTQGNMRDDDYTRRSQRSYSQAHQRIMVETFGPEGVALIRADRRTISGHPEMSNEDGMYSNAALEHVLRTTPGAILPGVGSLVPEIVGDDDDTDDDDEYSHDSEGCELCICEDCDRNDPQSCCGCCECGRRHIGRPGSGSRYDTHLQERNQFRGDTVAYCTDCEHFCEETITDEN